MASLVAHAHTHDLVSRHIIDVHGYTPAQNEANDDYGFYFRFYHLPLETY